MIDPELPEETAPVDGRLLRQFAVLWLGVWSALAVWQYSAGHTTRALVFGGLAVALGPMGLFRPETIRPVFAILTAVTRPIGMVMTRVVLAAAYYGMFTPIALFFRAKGRDPLARRRRTDAKTYWTTREQTQDPRRYLRQV